MNERVKIVVPDAGPINTLAAAGLLYLLLAPKNTDIVLIKSVVNEIIVREPELKKFIDTNGDRITIVATSVCVDDEDKRKRGVAMGKGRGDLAVADFIMNFVDEATGNSPALIIYEDKKLGRLSRLDGFSEKTHFITTAAYLRKLEEEKIISSFEDIWKQIVSGNRSDDLKIHRDPSAEEVEAPSSRGSKIFGIR